MVALTAVETLLVVIVKLTLCEPDGTVTDVGTVAEELLEDKVTVAPPVGANTGIVTEFPVVEPPPTTDVGLSVNAIRLVVKTSKVAEAVPFPVAVITLDWL